MACSSDDRPYQGNVGNTEVYSLGLAGAIAASPLIDSRQSGGARCARPALQTYWPYGRITVVPLSRRIRRRISNTLSVESTCGTGRPLSATIWSIERGLAARSPQAPAAPFRSAAVRPDGESPGRRRGARPRPAGRAPPTRRRPIRPASPRRGSSGGSRATLRLSTLPGTANTSRPCSIACRAVISAPLRSAASTTITPSDRPLMMRFRCGNVPASGCRARRRLADQGPVGGDLVGQLVVLRRIDVHHAAGQHGDGPAAGRQRAAMGGRVDAAGQAADDRQSGPGQAPASRSACRRPYCVPCRVPTMPMARASSGLISPRTNSTPGGSGISRSTRG